MNEFDERQTQRRERYRRRARSAAVQSTDELEESRRLADQIPMGQPILVGHHSEGRHRRHVHRIHRHMDKGLEAHKRAEHYERKAEGVGRAGISSDDPDALPKLRDQLSLLEATREAKKYLNKYWREHGKLPAAVDAELKTEALSNFQFAPGGTHVPFPPWALSNLGASIRRVKKRIKELEAEAERAPWPGIETEHVTVEESRPDNRMYFRFKAGKPSRDVCKAMRRNGWVWKPSENAWSRQLNNATRFKAEYTAARAGELMDQEAAVEQS